MKSLPGISRNKPAGRKGRHQILRYVLVIALAALFSAGCREGREKTTSAATGASVPAADTSLITSCPYLTHDTGGDPVLSWVQQDSQKSIPMMYYAVFSDSSKKFGVPHAIPPSAGVEPHGEDMPKIIFRKQGGILAVYAVKNPHPDNPYTGAVYYTQSFDGGRHWTPARPLVKDTARSFDQRYFDVALLPDDEVGIVWLNNSEPEGSTLYFARTRGNKGFSAGKVIGEHTCQCCRTDLLVDDSANIHIAWRTIYHDSIRDMDYCYSNDTGKTFSVPVRISPDNWVVNGCPHTGPSMAVNNSGIHFTWFTMGGGGGVYYCHTDNSGLTFSPRQAVSELASARHPQMAALPDNDLAIVWDEGMKYKNASYQQIELQMRGPGGLLMDTRPLTPDSVNAAFPQIKILNDKSALVAFTEMDGDKQQVRYRVVQLKP